MDRFKKLMKARGKKMADLAKCFGIERESLYSRLKNPKLETLIELCEHLDCHIIELFDAPEGYFHLYIDGEWLGIRRK